MELQILPGPWIVPQIGIPEGQRFEFRALKYLNPVAAPGKRGGESHVRSTLEFHLIFVARGRLFEGLTSPNWLLAKRPEIARTVQQSHGPARGVPRKRRGAHEPCSL